MITIMTRLENKVVGTAFYQLISTKPKTSMEFTEKSREEQSGELSKVSHFSVCPNLKFSSM